MTDPIYKICTRDEWQAACDAGAFTGSAVDIADGFIHFSTAIQARETAAKHFAGQLGLVLVTIDPDRLPADALKWEPSRGGALFPHLYAPLQTSAAVEVVALPWSDGTGHQFPAGFADG